MNVSPVSKQAPSFHVYHTSADDDYFYKHPITVILGFLGTVAIIVLCLICAVCIGHKIW